jgi:DNA-binding CsgD family transcriptional regulator
VTGGVVEREAELAALGEAIASGGVLVVAGPPGIGKSTLLRAAAAGAAQDGTRVLVAAGTPLERGFAFGTARALLEAPVAALPAGERAALLAGAARHALPVLEPGAAEAGPGDLHRTLHGLHWLVAGLAASGPLALVVDDAQWADEASLRFLAYLAPRLQGLPVTVLLGVRNERPPTGIAPLDALLGAGALRPEALSPDGVAEVLAEILGDEPGPVFARACAARTGGSPLLVRELAEELRAGGLRPDDAHAGEVAAALPPGVEELLLHRLAGVPTDARVLAEALALLGEDDPPGAARALAALDADAGVAAAAALGEAHLLDPADGRRLRHPLLRDAAVRALPPARAGLLHGHAARLLHRMGAPSARVVAHLLASDAGDGDSWAVGRLRDAAREALAQGAAAEAAAALRRALAEPPSAAERPHVLRELGEAELAALEPAAAEHLAVALREAPSIDLAVALATAHYHAARHAEAADVLLAELDRLGEDAREERLQLEAILGVLGRYGLETAPRLAGRLETAAEGLTGATPAERHLLAVLAEQRPGEQAEGLERAALAGEELLGHGLMPGPSEGVGTVAMHVHAGHPERAEALAGRLDAMALDAGSPIRHAYALAARVMVDLDVGRLAAAEEGSRAALTAMEGMGLAPVATTAGVLLQVLAERGDLDAAAEVEATYGLGGPVPETMVLNPMLYGRGVLRLAQGRDAEAAEDLRELGRRHARWDMQRPSPPWRSGAALALGDGAEARRLADEQVALARAWGTPRSLGPALRVAALCGTAEKRAAGLAAAVASLDGTPWRLELARARCDLGAELRRAGSRREARAQLEAAMGLAHACGATPLAERAADELRASGARPRWRAITGMDALTPSEERVARLAAAGRTNRDIAQELFITLATVETHLTRAYRKLGVPGREELAGALAPR